MPAGDGGLSCSPSFSLIMMGKAHKLSYLFLPIEQDVANQTYNMKGGKLIDQTDVCNIKTLSQILTSVKYKLKILYLKRELFSLTYCIECM